MLRASRPSNFVVTALLLCTPLPLVAQSGGGAERSAVLEEVVVTARKRAESIQETPVAVTAMSGDDLRERGIVNSKELAKSVPSLQINDSNSTQIYIRGIGQRSGLARQDPSVSVYLDGVFIARPEGQLFDTIDVDSVQVLRGPQGTLFGKNNTGGALVFTLTKPSDVQEGYIEGSLGNYNQRGLRAGINVPLTENFSSRMALNYSAHDGYLKEISTGDENASKDRLSGILQTRWIPDDAFVLDTLLIYGKIRERYPSRNCEITSRDSMFGNGFGLLFPGDTDPSNPSAFFDNCRANSRDALPDLSTNMGESQRQRRYLDTMMLAATLDWRISDTHSLKTIIGFNDGLEKGPQTQSDEGGPANFQRGFTLGDADQESLTLEFQLNGSLFNDQLEYAAGVFLQDELRTETFASGLSILGIDSLSLVALGAGQQPDPNNLPPGGTVPIVGALSTMDTVQNFRIEGTTAAVFAQGTYYLTDNFEFTLGGRYTEETRESTLVTRVTDNAAVSARLTAHPRFTPIVNPTGADMALHAFNGTWLEDPISIANSLFQDTDGDNIYSPLGPAVEEYDKATFSQFTPMASISYSFKDEWLDESVVDSAMVYATWSNGFKSGFQEPKGADGLVLVEPEKLENREIGFKIDAFNHSVRLNIAAYSMIFEDMQLITAGLDSTGTLVVTSDNAGKSQIDGAELELSWLPSADWLITFSYSNNNYKFLEFDDVDLITLGLTGEKKIIDRTDEQFPVSPEVTAALGIQHTLSTANGLFVSRLDVSHTGENYLGFDDGAWTARQENSDTAMADAYTLFDARFTWRNNEDDLSVSLFGKNITDERFLIGAVAIGDSLGTFTQTLGEPRFYGVEMRKTF